MIIYDFVHDILGHGGHTHAEHGAKTQEIGYFGDKSVKEVLTAAFLFKTMPSAGCDSECFASFMWLQQHSQSFYTRARIRALCHNRKLCHRGFRLKVLYHARLSKFRHTEKF